MRSIDIQRALAEDIGPLDLTAQLLPETQMVEAVIVSREPMVVCGVPWVNDVFHALDKAIVIEWLVEEGDFLAVPATLCKIKGRARPILTAERTALNFLQTLSGTATKTKQYADALRGTKARLLDTRKTIPGLRDAQKYAVRCGGGLNHRMGLYDAFLIKENHIKACGSVKAAIQLARASNPDVFLEIEVETLTQLQEALPEKPSRIMLDNFDLVAIKEAVRIAKPYECPLEVSGNVNLETLALIAASGVDYISVGALTKSVQAIDLSLRII